MGNHRSKAGSSFSDINLSLVTDSVILSQTYVNEAINGSDEGADGGDIIDGLRNGLLFSAAIWIALIFAGLFALS